MQLNMPHFVLDTFQMKILKKMHVLLKCFFYKLFHLYVQQGSMHNMCLFDLMQKIAFINNMCPDIDNTGQPHSTNFPITSLRRWDEKETRNLSTKHLHENGAGFKIISFFFVT
ncbi:hypothetical protein ACJX0J_010738 [Zea mays]